MPGGVDPLGLACRVCAKGFSGGERQNFDEGSGGDSLSELDAAVDGTPHFKLAKDLQLSVFSKYALGKVFSVPASAFDRDKVLSLPIKSTGWFRIESEPSGAENLLAGQYELVGRLHFAWFDVHEDNDGDCLIAVSEEGNQQMLTTSDEDGWLRHWAIQLVPAINWRRNR